MSLPVPVITIGLLLMSNIFMTFAWYGHLKFKAAPLLLVIIISWGIAFFEYAMQVPANRIGHGYFSAAQLKTIQEVITLSVFMVFSVYYLGEPVRWNHLVGFGLIMLGAWFVFAQFGGPS
ncbi:MULTISPECIES: DMT family protein [unclassified Yoonia]|uniref:DMT family protein n=1 Tax=unclassified Yoonia TaxID=2629118 RepID=UPI002AFF2D6C|nr:MULTISPECIES: DMT family protein [unclassified Yoonia]